MKKRTIFLTFVKIVRRLAIGVKKKKPTILILREYFMKTKMDVF